MAPDSDGGYPNGKCDLAGHQTQAQTQATFPNGMQTKIVMRRHKGLARQQTNAGQAPANALRWPAHGQWFRNEMCNLSFLGSGVRFLGETLGCRQIFRIQTRRSAQHRIEAGRRCWPCPHPEKPVVPMGNTLSGTLANKYAAFGPTLLLQCTVQRGMQLGGS